MEIIENREIWDSLVEYSPNSLLFHKWDFLKIIEEHSGYELLNFGIYDGEELVGVFPIFFKDTRLLKMAFSPPPKTMIPYLGYIMSNYYEKIEQSKKEHCLKALADGIDSELKIRSTGYFFASLAPSFLDARPFGWKGYEIRPYYTYIINLNIDLNDIWASYHKYTRRDIRKAEKSELMFDRSDDLSALYSLQERRYKEQNLESPIISMDYLEHLFKTFKDNLKIYTVCDKFGEILSASATVEFKKKVVGWMGADRTKFHANEFLIWNLIKEAKKSGFEEYDLSGANIERLCQFKSKFNPRVEMNLKLFKKNQVGRTAEWVYQNKQKYNQLEKIIKYFRL